VGKETNIICNHVQWWHKRKTLNGLKGQLEIIITSANKANKYRSLSNSHIFYPVAVEMAGAWNRLAIELIQEIGKRASTMTDDARETTFLFQRMSIAVHRGNAITFANTYWSLWYAYRYGHCFTLFNFHACRFVLVGQTKNNNRWWPKVSQPVHIWRAGRN